MEFRKVKLGDFCEVRSSKRIYAKEYKNFGIPFYRSKEIIQKAKNSPVTTSLFISKERFEEIKSKFGIPLQGDILLTSVGTLGVPYLVQDEEFYFKDGNLTWFTNFSSELNNEFLYYWFSSESGKSEIDRITIGSTQKALTIVNLNSLKIKLPPLSIQKKIVSVLKSIDEKFKCNLEQIKILENLSQTLFKHWFIDFEFPNEQGQPYKSSGGEMVESELGEIPKGFKIAKLKDIYVNYDSKRKPLSKMERSKREKIYPYYGAASLMDYVDDYLFDGTYLLLGEDGTVVTKEGYPVLQYVNGKFWVNNHAHVMKGKESFSTEYLYLLLSQTNISNIITGAVQPKISQKNLNNISTLLPNIEILNSFEQLINPIFNQRLILQKENQKLIQLRDTLLPKLLSGEIEIPDELEVN